MNPEDFIWPGDAARAWFDGHTLSARHIPPIETLIERKRRSGLRISVGLPALNEATTVGKICDEIRFGLIERHQLVDEIVLFDGGSSDDTAAVAAAVGARVVHIRDVLPEVPVIAGKGESLWRSLQVLRGELIVWIDADIKNFHASFVSRLVAPLLMNPDLAFVKGFYKRPIEQDGRLVPDGGGRVTELLARPMLNAFFPELAGFVQPLSGEYAGRREVLFDLPFFTGYSVEVGLLVDLLQLVGLERMAQVDLGIRVHRNRPLDELGPMAHAIGRTILKRAEERGRMKSGVSFEDAPFLAPGTDGTLQARQIDDPERPPMRLLPTYLDLMRGKVDPVVEEEVG